KPALQSVAVRYGPDQRSARDEHSLRFGDHILREAEMFEYLRDHDHVERRVLKRKRLIEIGPYGLDSELARPRERYAVDVDSDDAVPRKKSPAQRTVSTAQIQHP